MQRPDFLDEYHGVWNHRRLDCLFHIMFRRTTKKISKLCIAAPFVMGIQQRLVESPHKRPTMLLVLTWWRYQMETFSAMLALCAGNSPVNGEFPTKRPVTPMFFFYVLLDLRLNKRLSKQSRRRWFETPSCSLWRQCNEVIMESSAGKLCVAGYNSQRNEEQGQYLSDESPLIPPAWVTGHPIRYVSVSNCSICHGILLGIVLSLSVYFSFG